MEAWLIFALLAVVDLQFHSYLLEFNLQHIILFIWYQSYGTSGGNLRSYCTVPFCAQKGLRGAQCSASLKGVAKRTR